MIKALEKSKPLRERRYLTAFFGRADIASYPVALVFGTTEKIRRTKSEPEAQVRSCNGREKINSRHL